MVVSPVRVLSLCSGIGGLDRGVHAALRRIGYAPRTACYVEIEPFACAVLAQAMERGFLDAAPIWTDLKTFPAEMFAGYIDLVIGGYPCQPFSVAGKRKGEEDPRHLWPYIRNIIQAVRPSLCFFENVRGHLRIGFSTVKRELEKLGYEVEPGIFSAAEVGASHKRERLFILAYTGCGRNNWGEKREGAEQTGKAITESLRRCDVADSHETKRRFREFGLHKKNRGIDRTAVEREYAEAQGLADSTSTRHSGAREYGSGSSSLSSRSQQCDEPVADATDGQFQDAGQGAERRTRTGSPVQGLGDASLLGSQRCKQQASCHRNRNGQKTHGSVGKPSGIWLPEFPPGPTDQEAWTAILNQRPDLAPAISREYLINSDRRLRGLPPLVRTCRRKWLEGGEKAPIRDEATQCQIRQLADALSSVLDGTRVDALRGLGNAVVDICAERAFITLLKDIL